jgi:lipoprotein signal peptidase
MRRSLLLLPVCLLVFLDAATKAAVQANFEPGGSKALLGSLLKITYVQNSRGYSWWLPDLPPWAPAVIQTIFLLIVGMAFPYYLFYTQTRRRSLWTDLALVAVTAGLVGHLLDGLWLPFTIDFIQVFNSPKANLADIYSWIGIGAIMVETIQANRRRERGWQGFSVFFSEAADTRKEFIHFLRALVLSKGGPKE